MRKKYILFLIILAIAAVFCFIGINNKKYNGLDSESRERIVQKSNPKASIYREIIYDDNHILSELNTSNGEKGIAVFSKEGKKYVMNHSYYRDRDLILHDMAIIGDTWYHAYLYEIPNPDYALITVEAEGESPKTYKKDADGIILIEMPEGDHSISISYFDTFGNKYE